MALSLAALLPLVHFSAVGSPLPWWQRLLGSVPGVLALHASYRYLKASEQRLPFLEYALLQSYLWWGLPTVTYDVAGGKPVHQSAMTEALLAVCLATGFMLVAYPVGRRLGRRLLPVVDRILPRSAGPAAAYVLPYWLVVAALFNAGIGNYLPTRIQYAVSVLANYCPLFAYLYLRPRGQWGIRRGAVIMMVTIVLALAGFFTGMAESILRPILTAGILALVLWRGVPWRTAAVFVALLVVLQPAKHIYRSLAWWGEGETGTAATFENWRIAFSRAWFEDSDKVEQSMAIAARMNELGILGATFELTPALIPPDHGTQWKYIITALVPRFLNPDKPNLNKELNARFNVTFGLQSEKGTETTSFNYPLVCDGYWNFGWVGVALVGAAVGLLCGLFTTSLPIDSWGGLSLATTLLATQTVYSHLVDQFAGRVQQFVGIVVVCWLIRLLSAGTRDQPEGARLPADSAVGKVGS